MNNNLHSQSHSIQMDDQENAKGDQSDPAAKRNPVLSPPGKEDDLDDFGNFQDSETFGDFGDFGAFEGADERQSVEEQNWSADALARPDAPANPLQMSPGAFHQFLERCLSSFLPAEAKNDVVSQPPDSTENLERWFKSDSDLESLRKGNEIENSGANSKAHAVNGAADDFGRLALERVLKRLVSEEEEDKQKLLLLIEVIVGRD